jgi:hypothetical protein
MMKKRTDEKAITTTYKAKVITEFKSKEWLYHQLDLSYKTLEKRFDLNNWRKPEVCVIEQLYRTIQKLVQKGDAIDGSKDI